MAIQTRDQLKQWFETGDYPTQQHFWDWLDSFIHQNDKGPNPSDLVVTFGSTEDASYAVPASTQLLILQVLGFSLVQTVLIPDADDALGRVIYIDNRTVAPHSCEFGTPVYFAPTDEMIMEIPNGFRGVLISDGVRWNLNKYDDGTGTGGGASALNDLTDVNITSPADGDTLERVGGTFVNVNRSFTELTGTTWDGSNKYKTSLSGNLALTLNSTKVAGLLVIEDNNSHTLTINGTNIPINPTTATVIGFTKANGVYYIIDKDGLTIVVAGPDVTAPTVTSATATNANTIRLVFSEIMGAVTTAGHSFKQNGSTITPDSVTGSGTTWDFVFSETMLNTDTLLRSYNSSTGATTDAAGNELGSYTDQAVTNSISSEEFIAWSQLSNTTDAGSGTLDNANSSAGGATATKRLVKSNGNYVQMVIPATVSEADAFVLMLDNVNDANYLWASAGGGGVTSLAAVFSLTGGIYRQTGDDSGSVNIGISSVSGHIWRLEISGDDVLLKQSTNSGSSFSTIYTFANALSGITNIYIKGVLAVGSGSQRLLNSVKGSGLVTI